jgi:glutamate synthase (NADPH/NADH) small chain
MGKVTGFMEYERIEEGYKPVPERLKNYKEFVVGLDDTQAKTQAARCMDCGTPFCNNGCPVNNIIPDFNDLVYRGDWKNAIDVLHSTNNFPEFTGRICPAPCEAACTLNVNDDAIGIKSIEHAIIDRAWAEGWVNPQPALHKTGKKVAVVGSGPAGMAAAQQLARAGHDVTLFEKNDRVGGLLRYGIPDFKMEKVHVDRRVAQMEAEGVTFHYGSPVGGASPGAIDPREMLNQYDALALTGGAEAPRDLPIPGRDLQGIHFAMDFLPQQNRRVGNEPLGGTPEILAGGKHVVVIGGGDTGSDCIGTSFRQGALSVAQLEIMPAPPEHENKGLTWPNWPLKMRTSSSQAEGAKRDYAVLTQHFSGENGKVTKLHCVHVDDKFKPVAGTEFELDAELVLLAMGFVHPVHEGLLKTLGVDLDPRGNVRANTADYQTSRPNVFAAGDMRRGQSLVVWAIREGRLCARSIDQFLMGTTNLPR